MKIIKFIFLIILSIFVASFFLWSWEKALRISTHPYLSLLMRMVFVFMLFYAFILRKRELLVYYFILSFPFLHISFSGLSLFQLFAIILTILYFKDIVQNLARIDFKSYGIPLIILFGTVIYTTCIAYSKSSSIEKIIFFINTCLIGLSLRSYLNTSKDLKTMQKLLIVVFLFGVFVSFYQMLFGINSIRFFFGDYNSNTDIYGYAKRIPSIFDDAQAAGQYYSVMGIALLGLTKNSRLAKLLFILAIGALILTISRSAIISFFIGVIFLQLLSKKWVYFLIFLFISLLILFFNKPLQEIMPGQLKERFSAYSESKSADYRKMIWERSFPIIQQNPTGVGLGGLNLYNAGNKVGAIFIGNIKLNPSYRIFAHFENSFLSILYCLGWSGLIAIIWLILKFSLTALSMAYRNNTINYFLISMIFAFWVWLCTCFTAPLMFFNQPIIELVFIVVIIDYLFTNVKIKQNF